MFCIGRICHCGFIKALKLNSQSGTYFIFNLNLVSSATAGEQFSDQKAVSTTAANMVTALDI